jgi:dolichyl-diphosphooligosaccharide--protein glycosyltransferase
MMVKLTKKEIIIKLSIILFIVFIGFIIRADTAHLPGVSDDEKAFYQDQNGLPYMYEMDSYYNYRLTQNYLDHGYLGDTIINGTEWDLHSYYPPGRSAEYPPLLIYITSLTYKILNLFSQIPLLTVCFWIPAIIAPISGIISYFIVSRLTDDYGGIVAGILTVTVPFYFIRSVPGWFDTDIFNILFPLLIILFLFEGIYTKNVKYKAGFAILAAFSMFLFQTAWEGWAYLFYIILLPFLLYFAFCKIKGIKLKNICVFSIFLIFTTFFISIQNIHNLETLISPFQLLNTSVWPNFYITVLELQEPSLEGLLTGISPILFGLGILGLFMILRVLASKNVKKQFLGRVNWFVYLFLVVWTLTGLFALMKGSRFIMIIIPPLVISSGIMVSIVIGYLNILNNKQSLIKTLSLLIVIIFTVCAIVNTYEGSAPSPILNNNFKECAEWIQNNTPQDTVIISGWSYGYFFSAAANRSVAVDGGSQNTQREYWIYKALSTSNESLSAGILKMVSTSGDNGYSILYNYTEDTNKSVEILNKILGVNKKTAENILITNYNMNPKQVQNILKYTHPDNSAPFVIVTYNGMINIGNWIFNFGEWDFNKKQQENYTYSVSKVDINRNILNSSNGITCNLATNEITWNSKIPYCEIKVKDNKIEKHYLDRNSEFCIILLMDTNESIVLDKKFENSIFTKLIIENSESTKFKPVYKNEDITVWKTL